MDDERFKQVVTDPRFKNMRQRKVKIDKRFASMFKDKKFQTDDDLKRFYQVDKDDEDENGDEEDEEDSSENELSSSSDESSSDEEEPTDEVQYDWDALDKDAKPTEDATRRLAVCNFDWDYLNATDIFVLVNSFKQPSSVKVFLSDYGKERLEDEEKRGPKELVEMPTINEEDEEERDLDDLKNKLEVFKGKKNAIQHNPTINQYEDADEMTEEEREIAERIRVYQINRLKYYYAVVELDSVESANHVYKELDGIEYEGSSSALDLRFIPDDMNFEESRLKSECHAMPDLASYEAPSFINTALQQTKVNLTWDSNDHRRRGKLQKTYTMMELEKGDLEAYLASDSESEDEDTERDMLENLSDTEGEPKMNKYKRLLQKLEEEEAQKEKIDLEVKFSDDEGDDKSKNKKVNKDSENENDDSDEGSEDGLSDNDQDDSEDDDDEDNLEDDDEDNDEDIDEDEKEDNKVGGDDLIEDPIESDDERRKKERKRFKKNKKKKNNNIEVDPGLELMLLETDPKDTGKKHFNYRRITGEEKSKKVNEDGDFEFNPEDERFKAVYDSHLYNIDPSDNRFKRTKAYDELAKRKRQKKQREDGQNVKKDELIM